MYQPSKNTFIVLRDNKENGPYTFEQLRELGLKSSDLVWVEGQSVYWLSPSQVPELRDFPLDQVPEKVEPSPAATIVESIPVTETKPKNETATQPRVASKASTASATVIEEKWNDYLPGKQAAKTVVAAKPVAEVKDLYSKPELQQINFPRKPISFPAFNLKYLLYGGLLVAGIALGFLLRKGPAEKNSAARQVVNQSIPVVTRQDSAGTEQADSLPAISSTPEIEAPVKKPQLEQQAPIVSSMVDSPVSTIRDTAAVSKEVPAEKTVRTDDGRDARPKKENYSSYVSVHTNNYTVGSFGGIRDLQVTVRNDSHRTLDKVAVELSYLKPRDELLKTETIYFYLVPPDGSQTVPVKKSNRGIKVSCRVLRVDARDE
jgi:hypothetical protein